MEEAIEKYVDYLNNNNKLNIFDSNKNVALQVVLHKILNYQNDKEILW